MQTSESWRPLSARENEAEAESYRALHAGVPPWLEDSLWEWIEGQVSHVPRNYTSRVVRADLLRQLERVLQFKTGWDGKYGSQGLALLRNALKSNPKLMLNVADYLISHPGPIESAITSARLLALDKLLEEGASAYKVDVNADMRSARLIRRVDMTIEAAAKRSMEQQNAPSTLLRRAWNATYGLNPNASDGYRQAVRAVEAAAIPVILPNDSDATLGRVIGTLRNRSNQWQLSFTHRTKPEQPIATLISMMALLWEGQYDRHVTDGASLHISQEEAETALHLAVTLVQWFTSGRVSRQFSD
jgi:hypothetical protein